MRRSRSGTSRHFLRTTVKNWSPHEIEGRLARALPDLIAGPRHSHTTEAFCGTSLQLDRESVGGTGSAIRRGTASDYQQQPRRLHPASPKRRHHLPRREDWLPPASPQFPTLVAPRYPDRLSRRHRSVAPGTSPDRTGHRSRTRYRIVLRARGRPLGDSLL